MSRGSAIVLLRGNGLLTQPPELLSQRLVLLVETLNVSLRVRRSNGSRTAFLDSLAEICSRIRSQPLVDGTNSSTARGCCGRRLSGPGWTCTARGWQGVGLGHLSGICCLTALHDDFDAGSCWRDCFVSRQRNQTEGARVGPLSNVGRGSSNGSRKSSFVTSELRQSSSLGTALRTSDIWRCSGRRERWAKR